MDYKQLDEAIIKHIAGRRGHPTNSMALESIARQLIETGLPGRNPYPVAWRLIDRRMQAMRKAGRIRFVRGPGAGWEVVDTKEQA